MPAIIFAMIHFDLTKSSTTGGLKICNIQLISSQLKVCDCNNQIPKALYPLTIMFLIDMVEVNVGRVRRKVTC